MFVLVFGGIVTVRPIETFSFSALPVDYINGLELCGGRFVSLLAKYDSSNENQIPGYLIDLFSYWGRPRKGYQHRLDLVQNALELESQ